MYDMYLFTNLSEWATEIFLKQVISQGMHRIVICRIPWQAGYRQSGLSVYRISDRPDTWIALTGCMSSERIIGIFIQWLNNWEKYMLTLVSSYSLLVIFRFRNRYFGLYVNWKRDCCIFGRFWPPYPESLPINYTQVLSKFSKQIQMFQIGGIVFIINSEVRSVFFHNCISMRDC